MTAVNQPYADLTAYKVLASEWERKCKFQFDKNKRLRAQVDRLGLRITQLEETNAELLGHLDEHEPGFEL